MRSIAISLLVVALFPGAGAAKPRLVVLPTVVDASARGRVPGPFDELVLVAAAANGRFEVIGPSDLEALLGLERLKDAVGCDDVSCFSELGGALGAEKLASLQVALLGDEWLVTSKLIDTRTLVVEARSGELVAGGASALVKATPALLGRLFAGDPGSVAAPKTFQCSLQRPAECETQCSAGHAGSCHVLGRILRDGLSVPTDAARAVQLFERACTAGRTAACVDLGDSLARGRGAAKDLPRAAALADAACTAGNLVGCHNLGVASLQGDGRARDAARARELFERACAGGEGRACGSLAFALEQGQGGPKDAARAVELYLRTCAETGDVTACANVLALWRGGRAPTLSGATGRARLDATCEQGGGWLCYELAGAYAKGTGVPVDGERARRFWRKGCDGGVAEACRELVRDRLRALPAGNEAELDRLCARGNARVCYELGYAFANDVGRPTDLRRAATLYGAACRQGLGRGCTALRELPARACAKGDAALCDTVTAIAARAGRD
jgi:hypothetical protein